MDTRHKRALKKTSLMAIFLSVPLVFIVWIKTQYKSDIGEQSAGETGAFYLETRKGESFTNINLRNQVTLMAIAPSGCLDCTIETFDKARLWAEEHLSYEGIKKVPYQLVLLGEARVNPGSEWIRLKVTNTQGVAFEEEIRPFLGDAEWTNKLTWVLINEKAELTGVFPNSDSSWSSVTRLWSKVTFNHYLSDYLSKRTFFGPKKEGRYQSVH